MPDFNPETPTVAVVVECVEGTLGDPDKGMLSQASRLAEMLGWRWVVLALAEPSSAGMDCLESFGVSELLLVDVDSLDADCVEIRGRLLAQAAEEDGALLLMAAHTDLGESLAPVVAAELEAGLFTEAIGFEGTAGGLKLSRKVVGFRAARESLWAGDRPLVVTLSPEVLSAVLLPSVRRARSRVRRFRPRRGGIRGLSRVLERIPPDPQTVDVADAEVIFSAGLGCRGESFELLREIARKLNVSLGVTRPMYDLGAAGFERMVGQTGRTVAPRLYLALGISGSMHHIGGIKDSRRVIALNSDPKAPIFPNSDEGYVADLDEVLPLLARTLGLPAGGAV